MTETITKSRIDCLICQNPYTVFYLYIVHLRSHFLYYINRGICPICGENYRDSRGVMLHFMKTRSQIKLHRALAFIHARKGGRCRKKYRQIFEEIFIYNKNRDIFKLYMP